MPWLINAAQLDKFRKSQKNVIILDTSWHLAGEQRDAKQEFIKHRISGARFFDIEAFNDTTTSMPNMLTRDESLIAQKMGELGITNDVKIILYDHSKLHTSCRALWMLKTFGHNPNLLYVLDGGFSAWERYGGKIETGDMRMSGAKSYDVIYQAQNIRTLVQMKSNLHHPKEQVVDVRHPVRYAGGPEDRPGLRAGHIPGSYCFPYFTMFEADGRFKPSDKIKKQFWSLGIDLRAPIVTTCGSGITSAILDFILDLWMQTPHAIYDGSWSEWGAENLYPGETSINERPVVTSLEN